MEPKLETFEEYWKTSPGLGDLTYVRRDLAMKIIEAAFVAGQSSALKWANKKSP